jgi:hypothetical protein
VEEVDGGGLAVLAARDLIAEVAKDVDGQPGVVLGDGDGVCELSEAFGQPAAIAERLERVAATLLARAAELKRPPIPERPRPGDLGVPPHWT